MNSSVLLGKMATEQMRWKQFSKVAYLQNIAIFLSVTIFIILSQNRIRLNPRKGAGADQISPQILN